jgi:hypothetical protein
MMRSDYKIMFLASFRISIFEYLQKDPQEVQRLIGLKYEQVRELLNYC